VVADAAGLDRAQAEETPKSDSAAPLNRLMDMSSDAALFTPFAIFFMLAQGTDIAVFPALKSA
jgi:hypothetical protein